MPPATPSSGGANDKPLGDVAALRSFSGPPKEFWPRYLNCLGKLTAASKVVLLLQDPAQPGNWKRIGEWPVNQPPSRLVNDFNAQLEDLATRSLASNTGLIASMADQAARSAAHFALATRLQLFRTTETCVAVLLLSEVTEAAARESLLRTNLAADVPQSYQMNQAITQATADVEKLAIAQDLMVGINAEKRFLAAALTLCNGLATSFKCQRVSLGWLQGGYVKLRAISRTEKFDRQMAAAQSMEAAMEETLDQDDEVLWPQIEGATVVTRDHEKFARDQGGGNLCSLPLRVDGEAKAVVLCERQESDFTAIEVQQLRLCCDQATRRLADLQRRDRWVGARLVAWVQEHLAMLVGPKHTWAKAFSLLGAVLLALLFLLRVPYRVEGNFVLKSDDVSFRTAPFDGYIEQVFVRPGDEVKAGDKLVKLMTRELELQEFGALADVTRYHSQAEAARATNGLAEMRVALALADQAQARLGLARHRLSEATVLAPFDGVIVEGDLRDRLAAPVQQGDALLKVARIDNLYAEAEIHERDVHEILQKGEGEIAFVSQPKLKFPVRLEQVEPAAFPRREGNVFLVRCTFSDEIAPWWRPGMSGLCKVEVENRTLWWIVTHRTVDFLRMMLWW